MKKEIWITLKNLEEAVHPFNNNMLSETLENYLRKECTFVRKDQIVLVVQGLKTKKEQKQFEELVQSYYRKKEEELRRFDVLDDIKRIILFFLGILFLLCSQLLIGVMKEVLLVAGWVAIWEVVYDILFLETKRKREYYQVVKLSKSEFSFQNSFFSKK